MKNQALRKEESEKRPQSVEDIKTSGRRGAIIETICILMVALFLFLPSSMAAEKTDVVAANDFLSIGAERFLLDNGLNVILKKDNRTPTAAIILLVNIGSATEGQYSGSGITHFIEHMLFKGTANYTAVQLEDKLKSLGAEINAFTTFDYTCFKVQAPATSLKPILNIITDIVKNPAFANEEFMREKQVILREIDMDNDAPEKYLYRLLWQTAYRQHPYKNPIIGYRDIFQRLERLDLLAYYKQYYIPDNMVLSVVGDIEPQVLLADIKQTLGTLNRQKFSSSAVSLEPQQISSRKFFKNFAVSRPLLLIGFHSVGINDSDLYALDTLDIILGGGLTSRLYKSLHDEKNLLHSINSYNHTPLYPGMFIISAVTKEGSLEETVAAIKEEIKKIAQSPPKENELKKAKAQALSTYLLGLETQLNKAHMLAVDFTMTGDLDFSGKYIKGIENVTVEDIKRVAEKYLKEENMTIVALLPENQPIKSTQSAQVKEQEKPQTIREVLPNGLVILITENHTSPICSITVSIKGGLRTEDEKYNGISNLAAASMLKGTTAYKKDEIVSLIESLGARFSPYSGNNSFGFTVNFMSKNFEEIVDLLASILLNPTFPEEELTMLKNDNLAQIELIKDDIFQYTNLSLRKNLFKNHPYRFISIGTKESVSSISRTDLVEFHKKSCVAKNTVISIWGDINSKNVLDNIKGDFKSMPEGSLYEIQNIAIEPIKGDAETIERMDKNQSVVMIGFRGVSLYDKDRYPLEILSSLFSDGGGRLYSQIRQKEGLAYTLGTFGMVGLDTGAFIFYAATTPQNVGHVKMSIISQIQKICNGEITDDEVNAAKKILITKHQLELQTNEGLSIQTGLDELYGLGYNYYLQYSDIINSVSKKDIITTARKYFKLDNCAIVITMPEKK